MRTNKTILRKINEWDGNPMLVAGMYRLFTYLPWELVPEKYKEFFPPEAKDTWDDDIGKVDLNVLKQDIVSEVRAILNVLAKRNVTHALGLIPMILADLFIIDRNIGAIQGNLSKIINDYKDNVDIDRELAEQLSMFNLIELLESIITKANIELTFDFDKAVEQVLEAANKLLEEQKDIVTPAIDKQIDQALKEYKEKESEA
jgi:hypothetical protein